MAVSPEDSGEEQGLRSQGWGNDLTLWSEAAPCPYCSHQQLATTLLWFPAYGQRSPLFCFLFSFLNLIEHYLVAWEGITSVLTCSFSKTRWAGMHTTSRGRCAQAGICQETLSNASWESSQSWILVITLTITHWALRFLSASCFGTFKLSVFYRLRLTHC